MIRPGIMLTAAVLISAAGGMADAKMAMQTFPVPAGAGPHDVYQAPDGVRFGPAGRASRAGVTGR
jgi:streptogramin lyase